MINFQIFAFNSFQVNTIILHDETKECVIIDAACYTQQEKETLVSYIKEAGLTPKKLINTHNHIDHILGSAFVCDTFDIPLCAHKEGDVFLKTAHSSATVFGMEIEKIPTVSHYIEEGDIIEFGNSSLKVIYTPGHADGSICLYNKEQNFLIVGDVLFKDSIGRTDLPTGDYDLLHKNINEKLFSLGDDIKIYPGHGPQTTTRYEKANNPFLQIL
ncbi:MAG: MBL fold metallo-hydrolase [Bacteroidota bacterium]|nr:MBL fold metallo-hydrolase [Bacteroidota bacterium]